MVWKMQKFKLQMIGQWMTNPQSIGSSIALKGPMGTGKTTFN